ncbi:hypothetical protein GHT06_015960 [Daphnia sinensis]|uniref:Uncharacterized protein n=1 Tax=Daphnia sinensis TaxID=1820382 RepID=A0AAD5PTA7_9CRUS|nr:hypothetical protein GHT06_015960 [Daphnia sinensis]
MALKQVFLLLAALCAVMGRPTEMDNPLLKPSEAPEMGKTDLESEQTGMGGNMNYYPLGRPMAFIPVYYLPPHGIAPKLRMRRPMQKEGEAVPTMVFSNPKGCDKMMPEKEVPLQAGQKNLQDLNPPSIAAQPAQPMKNPDTLMGTLPNVEERKMHEKAPIMNPQSSSFENPAGRMPELDQPISRSTDRDQEDVSGMIDAQRVLVPLSEPSPLAIPRLKRSPQFYRPPYYGYERYGYEGYGGYGDYGGYGGYGPYGYPGYGDEIIDIEIDMY